MTRPNLDDRCAELERLFTWIQGDRMRDVPILNSALEVEAVGFRDWQDGLLGVLLTPWFMNLVLLPDDPDRWSASLVGTKFIQSLPSGAYEFILGHEAPVGAYQMCSLFSPVLQFPDQTTAVATAQAAMTAVLDPANHHDVSTREQKIVDIWNTGSEDPECSGTEFETLEKLDNGGNGRQHVTRRQLLRGMIQQETE